MESDYRLPRDQTPANIRRKVDALDLPKPMKLRVRDEELARKLEVLRKDLDQRAGKHGDQSLLEYVSRLAWRYHVDHHRKPQEQLDTAAER